MSWLLMWLAAGCAGPEVCDLEAIVAERTPDGAVDCGTSGLDDDEEVLDCLAEAFTAGSRFVGTTQTSVRSGLFTRTLLGRGGQVELLLGDFGACGEDGCTGLVQSLPCDGAAVEEVDGRDRLTCTWSGTVCRTIVCGGEGEVCGEAP